MKLLARVAAAVKLLAQVGAAEKHESFAARIVGSIAAYRPGMAKEAFLAAQMTTMAD